MTNFHVNLGLLFAKPYESCYAMWRRCLSANPGISLQAIETNMRSARTNSAAPTFDQRLLQLQPSLGMPRSPVGISNSHTRQCPICATLLYHTDVFAVPWLEACPIHHCELVTECPGCQQPWPNKKELDKRDCPVCGRPDFDALATAVASNQDDAKFDRIGKLYALVQYATESTQLHIINERARLIMAGLKWWRPVASSSPLFPSFMSQWHPDFAPDPLVRLHVTYKPVFSRTSRIRPDNTLPPYEDSVPCETPLPFLGRRQTRLLRDHFRVTKDVLSWIANTSNCDHVVHVSVYRGIGAERLVDEPDLCPFCLAFSLWLFHTCARFQGDFHRREASHYPFVAQSGCVGFFDNGDPYVTSRAYPRFVLDTRFSSWFYRRGLELTFIEIVDFALYLREHVAKLRRNELHGFVDSPYQPKELPGQACALGISDGHFHCGYEGEHPLDSYSPRISTSPLACQKFHARLDRHKREPDRLVEAFPTSQFSYDAYLSVLRAIRRFF